MKKKLLFLLLCFTMIFVVACSEEGDYYDGFKVDNSVKEDGDSIPSGGEYTKKATKAVYTSGQNMPEKAAMGDTYKYGDYTYTMRKDGWSVALSEGTDKAKEAYGEILETIASFPIIDLNDLFKECTNMKTAPKLPDTVQTMSNTFYGCAALEEIEAFPSSLEKMQYVCYDCTSLKELPDVPASVNNMQYAFSGCSSITKAPKLPDGLTILSYAFDRCSSLLETPEIPATVKDMAGAFKSCTSLVKATEIPVSVEYLTDTFNGCTSLTGTVVINANPGNRAGCFASVNFAAQGLEVTGASTMIDKLMQTGIVN